MKKHQRQTRRNRNSTSSESHPIQNAQEAIHLDVLPFLTSAEAQTEASRWAHVRFPEDTAATLLTLRKQYTATQSGALLALVRLRQIAGRKFPQASKMYFTQDALEQATAWDIATYRAARLHALASPGDFLDLGSGIGGDALALAQHRTVHAFERDPVRSALLAANANALGLAHNIHIYNEDWESSYRAGTLPDATGIFLDPPRREGGRRLMRVEQVLGSWEPMERWQADGAVVCLKLMPGIADTEIPQDATVEFISHERVCKEAVIWLGSGEIPARRAAVFHMGHWHTLTVARDARADQVPLGDVRPGQILYEPDPAVIRAGPFVQLCQLLDAHLLDAQIAYLVSRETHVPPVATPFASAFHVDEVHDYSLRTLNARLQARGVGVVELKKRGVPFEPETLRPRLKLADGGVDGVVIFTRQGNRRLMILGRRAGGNGIQVDSPADSPGD